MSLPSGRGFTRIIVAVDGSDVSLRAAEHAARIAKQDGAELVALHIVPVPQFEVKGDLAEIYASARRDARTWMKDVEDIATRNGIGMKTEVVVGAYSVIDAILDSITAELKKGSEVRLVGFGTFVVSHRAATEGRNPRTGEAIKIPAKKLPRFRAGKGLKDAIA